ncbi:MAG TPA: DegT/DnrJ/EryC1/StrS family aminotransferase, partial [candidate division Zixibacteria bacterium]|nr:DegT/DnrJ/EryC1/StrS family aminotransferase [candidate division Zixibacteria bacterium]
MKRSKAPEKISLYDLRISRAAIDSVRDSLKSGWLSAGPKVAEFEKAICKMTGARYGVAVGSATTGLQMALASADAERGREVVTTPFTFVATVEAILATGARPVFADIDPYSLNIDPESVAKKISKRTVAVMPVDIGGYPVDYSAIRKICRTHKVALIADNAHAIGAAYKGKPVSSFSDLSVISFHATKNLVCGEGGIVLSNRKQLIDRIRLQSRHGLTSTAFQRKGK